MINDRNLTKELCDRLLSYDKCTGLLFWKERERCFFRTDEHFSSWNSQNAGAEAFTSVSGTGYKVGAIFHRNYLAHRVIWLMCKGEWPDSEIDHINGNPSDNRIINLRDVPASVNSVNKRIGSNNTSGVIGVMRFKATGKWQAQIKKSGVKYHLGYFDDFDDAVKARRAAESSFGFHENHGRQAQAFNERERLL